MNAKTILALLIVFCCAFALAMPDMSEAARMGGGRSFGSRPSMSTPAPRPSTTQNQGMNRQQTQQPGATAAAPRAGGMFGGMGGLFGGLLAGTLIGSLLGGHGFAGGGFLDILLFGLLAFVGFKLFSAFRNSRSTQTATVGAGAASQHFREEDAQSMQRTDNGAGWDALSSPSRGGNSAESSEAGMRLPEDFDADEFMRGAKMAYTRLQDSWDKRDLADIANFTTPVVQNVLREQMAEDPNPGKTEILLINAQLQSAVNEGAEQRASVYFDVLLRELPDQQQPSSAREIWHFVRSRNGGSWKLDGIQQVE
ncbi:MAG: Tim44 domain-containing protein [Desulfovibrio sp.]|nr:Tim44 domain-containing protein [Desulfovibrio sp.]